MGGGFPTETLMDAEGTQQAGGGAQPSRGEPSCRTAFRAERHPAATRRGAGGTRPPTSGALRHAGPRRASDNTARNLCRLLAALGGDVSAAIPAPRTSDPAARGVGSTSRPGPRPQLRARGQGGSHAAGRGNEPLSPATERDGTDQPPGPPAAGPRRRGGREGRAGHLPFARRGSRRRPARLGAAEEGLVRAGCAGGPRAGGAPGC